MAMAAATERSLQQVQQEIGGEDWGRNACDHGSYGGDDDEQGKAPS
jgi:hypothetical protein